MPVQEAIDCFKQKVGADVNVRCRYVDGSYYKDKPVGWYAETSRFKVGPESTLAGALEKLESLHGKKKTF